jgi:hypothetical protein
MARPRFVNIKIQANTHHCSQTFQVGQHLRLAKRVFQNVISEVEDT